MSERMTEAQVEGYATECPTSLYNASPCTAEREAMLREIRLARSNESDLEKAREADRALLQKCATVLEPFARFLDVLESKSSRLPTAEAIHEIHYPAGDAEINRTMLRTARALLADLRAVGVEPKP